MGIKDVIHTQVRCVLLESDDPSRMANQEFATQLAELDREPSCVANYVCWIWIILRSGGVGVRWWLHAQMPHLLALRSS
eukprot:678685-Amphidinium_carterae.2